ncbi:MAG: alpha/beta fold hydrolase [Candidatus Velamenicoccus archaeovorus]
MSRRRTALVTAGLAAGVVAGGAVGKVVLARRRSDPEAHEPLSILPPDVLEAVESFDGTRLAVRAAGDPGRPTIVFVHGFSLDMTTWHYQWTGLSERFRCVLFDLRSHGRSEAALSGDLSVEAMGRDLAAVLERVAPGRAVVVGHSIGAMSILSMASSRPDLLERSVAGTAFVGAAASDLLRGAMGSVTQLLRPRLGSLTQAARRVDRLRRYVLSVPTDVAGLVARITQFGPDASPHLVSYVVGLAARAPGAVWTDGLAGLMGVDLRDALRRVTVPSLVMVGEHDRVTPPSSAVLMAGELPDARLAVIEAAGHMAMLERHEDVNERLGAFVEEVLGGRSARGVAGDVGAPPSGRRSRS